MCDECHRPPYYCYTTGTHRGQGKLVDIAPRKDIGFSGIGHEDTSWPAPPKKTRE